MRFESAIHGSQLGRAALAMLAAACVLSVPVRAQGALQWAGRTWNVTSGGMAGVAQGSASNVSVDENGYLHLKITKTGNVWTAAELFTTDKLGFGTYQWQVDAPIDRFDKNVVLGLYPYGPAAGIGKDGTNEIDIEYSFWGNANGANGDWTDYPASGTTIGEKTYKFSLNGGTLSTSRFIWSTTQIENFLFSGVQATTSVAGLINSWTYAPNNSKTNIPQQALPLGINLWCFDNPPSDGKDVEVVIRNFQFVAEGTAPGGSGGTSAGGASGNAGTSSGGASGHAGTNNASGGTGASTAGASNAGGTNQGGTSASGGAVGTTDAGSTGNPSSAGSNAVAGSSATAGAAAGSAPSGAGSAGGTSTSGANGTPDSSAQGASCSVDRVGTHAGAGFFLALPLLLLGRGLRRRRAR